MTKETEELILVGVGLLLLIRLLGTSSSTANALALAKINAGTDTAYASDAANVVGDFTDMLGDD